MLWGYIGGNGGLPEMTGSLGTMKVYFTLIAKAFRVLNIFRWGFRFIL